MTPTEEEVRDLKRVPFSLICPNCDRETTTDYTKWEISVLAEHAQSFIEVDCNNCHAHIIYTPSTQEATVAK